MKERIPLRKENWIDPGLSDDPDFKRLPTVEQALVRKILLRPRPLAVSEVMSYPEIRLIRVYRNADRLKARYVRLNPPGEGLMDHVEI